MSNITLTVIELIVITSIIIIDKIFSTAIDTAIIVTSIVNKNESFFLLLLLNTPN